MNGAIARATRLTLPAALFLVCGVLFAASDKDIPPAELVNTVNSPGKNSRVRSAAAEKLGALTDSSQVRDNRVVESLLAIVANKQIDMFVREACIDALGSLQVRTDPKTKEKFMPVFTPFLVADPKDDRYKDTHLNIRQAIARVYAVSLRDSVNDANAYQACVNIAKTRAEIAGLRGTCVEVIGSYGAKTALDDLIVLLTDPETFIVEKAAAATSDVLTRSAGELPLVAINRLVEMLDSKTIGSDLKVNVMRVLGQLMRDTKGRAAQAGFPKICAFVANSQDDKLVKGGIEALGIIGSAEAVEPLKKAYQDYMSAPAAGEKPAAAAAGGGAAAAAAALANAGAANSERSKEAEMRAAVVDAMGTVLNFQGEKTVGWDAKAVHECAMLLIKAGEDDPATAVQEGAVFSLQYLYYPKFKAEHPEAVDMLTFKMREPKTTDDLKGKIRKTLRAITGQDYGVDAARWDKWFQDNMGKRNARPGRAGAR